MSDIDPIKSAVPICYAVTYMRLAPVARELGYALTLHGSMRRDLDLVAIPWTKDAVGARVLAESLARECGGFMRPHEADDEFHRAGKPGYKPHGRLGWVILLGGQPYIDLSVMPRRQDWDDFQRWEANPVLPFPPAPAH